MLKAIILLIIMTFISQVSGLYSQDKRGKVVTGLKKCTVYYYTYKFGKLDLKSKEKSMFSQYDVNGNCVEEIWYNSNGLVGSKNIYTYDEKGNIIEKTSYDAEGAVNTKKK